MKLKVLMNRLWGGNQRSQDDLDVAARHGVSSVAALNRQGSADEDLKICFEYQCVRNSWDAGEGSTGSQTSDGSFCRFASLSGAALSANATLANTQIPQNPHGMFPIDSPRFFVPVNGSLLLSTTTSLGSDAGELEIMRSTSNASLVLVSPTASVKSPVSAPTVLGDSLLSLRDLQTAGGPAGEDRVQVVCSEEDGWLYCGVYDGFNGRDAADFVAANLYRAMAINLKLLEWRNLQADQGADVREGDASAHETFQNEIKYSLAKSVKSTQDDFLNMVDDEMHERQELAMVGCCLLSVFLHGNDLYTVNLGDSRAVLGTGSRKEGMEAIQLTMDHSVTNSAEIERMTEEHPEEDIIRNNRVKGKLRVTRAFGAGFLKDGKYNDGLLPIFRVRKFISPPYISSEPYVTCRNLKSEDRFVVLGSDGLFDFFSNFELVTVVADFMESNPSEDPATFLLEEVLRRAARKSNISLEKLKSIPSGERRKFHDDVSVVVISLEKGFQTATASMRC